MIFVFAILKKWDVCSISHVQRKNERLRTAKTPMPRSSTLRIALIFFYFSASELIAYKKAGLQHAVNEWINL